MAGPNSEKCAETQEAHGCGIDTYKLLAGIDKSSLDRLTYPFHPPTHHARSDCSHSQHHPRPSPCECHLSFLRRLGHSRSQSPCVERKAGRPMPICNHTLCSGENGCCPRDQPCTVIDGSPSSDGTCSAPGPISPMTCAATLGKPASCSCVLL